MFSMATATATEEQVEAAKSTIKLEENIRKFIIQSQSLERSNKRLTHFILLLSFVQAVVGIIVLFK